MTSTAATLNALIGRVGDIATPFSIELPDGEKRKLGQGDPEFCISLRNERALRALRSLDEGNISEAYLSGDIDLEGEIMVMRRRLAAAAAPAALAARRAVALEGLLAVDASVALTRLFERRFATLLRLRMRSNTPELLPDGRPFLDLGRALREAAEAWR